MRYFWTCVFTLLSILSIVVVMKKGDIVTGPEVFLPGYKPGISFEEIEDPDVQALVKSSEIFGDRLNVLIILKSRRSLFERGMAEELEKVVREISKVEGVKSILSVLDIPKGLFGTYIEDDTLSKEILRDPNAETLITDDGRRTVVVCFIDPKFEPVKVVSDLRRTLSKFKDFEPLIFGEPAIDEELFKELKRQNYLYPPLIFISILIVFYLQTRSFRASLLSITIPVMASMMVMAIHFLLGNKLNTMTAMVTSYLMIIGSAYGLHFYNAVSNYGDTERALKEKFKPITFSMLTTAAGFSSFVFLEIRAFKEFGILVSSGLVLIVIMVFTVMKELVGPSRFKVRNLGARYPGDRFAKVVLAIMVVMSVLSPFILKNLKIGSTGLEYFREDSEVLKAYRVLRESFNFRDTIYLIIEKRNFTAKDNDKLKELAQELEKIPGIESINFPFDVPLPMARMFSARTPFFRTFISKDAIRLLINLNDKAFDDISNLRKKIEDVVKRSGYNFTLAGTILLWNKVNSKVLESQLKSMAYAFLMIFTMMYISFRNLRISFVGVVPIAFTTVMNFVNMALLRINLEISTAIIASMLMGLTIDYSIHLISESVKSDPENAVKTVGPAILANALGLNAGFFVLLFSTLKLFFNVSILTILGISLGAFLTLTVEPYLLKKIKKDGAVSNATTRKIQTA